MTKKLAPAKEVAQTRSYNGLLIDHARIVEEDYIWLAAVERLTLWNVQVPKGFLASLQKLWWLDLRGGSAPDLSVAEGASKLRYLAVNQFRGMKDLSVVVEMLALRYLLLYGLPKVLKLPSFASHEQLEHLKIGQMKGLLSLAEAHRGATLTPIGIVEANLPHFPRRQFDRQPSQSRTIQLVFGRCSSEGL